MKSSSKKDKPRGERTSKAEGSGPKPAEPGPAEPGVAEPPARAAPEEIPVPEDSLGSGERGRDRDRRRGGPQQDRSSSIRSIKGKGKEKGKDKGKKGKKGDKKKDHMKGKGKGKAEKGKSKAKKGPEENVTPRSAASAPVFGTFQSSMDGSWTMPPMMGMPTFMDPRVLAQQIQQRTGWYQDPSTGKWWFWDGSRWWSPPESGSWPSTTESHAVQEGNDSRGKGSGSPKKDAAKKEVKKEDSKKEKPRDERSKKEVKKERSGGPGGGDDGGDDDGDEDGWSEYTYDYEEEEPEEEANTHDPSVAPSTDRRPAEPRQPPRTPPRTPGGSQGSSLPVVRRRRDPPSEAATTSTARTAEIQEMLQSQARRSQQERSKPSISQVKVEAFRGSRSHFKDWKKILEAQQALYKLDEQELAMLVYLSCEGEARQVLNQLEVSEMREPGGLQRIMRLLEESYGARADERFEERQEAYNTFRRTPGMSIAGYISTLKRLRQEYLKEDPDTVLSDKSFAQRLLTRAALTRKERYDIFFAAGGRYASGPIERVMRFRCQTIHLDEKKQSHETPRKKWDNRDHRGRASYGRRRPERQDRRTSHRPSRHSAHVAGHDEEDEDWEEEENEDELENEDLENEALNMEGGYGDEQEDEEYYEDEEQDPDDDEAGGSSVREVARAFVQGWKAKSQSAETRKGRGYRSGSSKGKGNKGKGKRPPDDRKVEDRKRNSTCASCGQKGHWHGDPECPKVKSGEDKPRGSNFAGVATSVRDAKRTKVESGERTTKPKQEAESEEKKYERMRAFPKSKPQKPESPVERDEEAPDWGGDDSSSPEMKVSKVNWTFMVGGGGGPFRSPPRAHGWELIQEYDSSSDSDSDSSVDQTAFPVAPRASTRTKTEPKYEVNVATMLAAIEGAGLDDEILRKLKKKEKKVKKEQTLQSQPDMRMMPEFVTEVKTEKTERKKVQKCSAEQVLEMLPFMDKRQKKELYKALKSQNEAEALKHFPDHIEEERLKRRDSREGGYSARPRPSEAASSSQGQRPPAKGDMPEPVRQKRMQEFRWKLFEAALNKKGRLIPSEASAFPISVEQEECHHNSFKDIVWRANGAAHWGNCRKCGLKKVLYFSQDHGSLVSEIYEESVVYEISLAEKGEVILDSGCRTAVAGRHWHDVFQKRLKKAGLEWYEVEHDEVFRFGAGAPVQSTTACIYPVRPGGGDTRSWLRLAVVDKTSRDDRVQFCPALVGPSEMARWNVQMDFGEQRLKLGDSYVPMTMSATHHPVISLLGVDSKMSDWDEAGLQSLLETLRSDPYSMALLGEKLDEAEKESDEIPEKKVPLDFDMDDEVEALAEWQESLEAEAVALWDEVRPHLDPECFITAEDPRDERESSLGSLSEGESETTHAGSSDSSSEDTSDEERAFGATLNADPGGDEEILNKGQRRRLLAAAKQVQEAATSEIFWQRQQERKKEGPRKSPSCLWKVIEIFSWTCMISRLAASTGRWQFCEPITIEAGWDLTIPEMREAAFAYLQKVEPDLVVVAWPCGPWSVMQRINQRTPQQVAALKKKRLESRKNFLSFTRRVALWQRRRGGAIMGENPEGALSWHQPEIIDAFAGCSEQVLDQCQYGLIHPHTGEAIRKRTKVMGQEKVIQYLNKKCPGDHTHHPVEGGIVDPETGKWRSLSSWVGGYHPTFCKAILAGAEDFLRSNQAYVTDEACQVPDFPEGEEVVAEQEEFQDQPEGAEPEEFKSEDERMDEDQRHPIPREVQKAVEFAHRQLGHPSRSTLIRMLKASGATPEAVRHAKKWTCDVCAARRAPKHPQAATPAVRPYGFGKLLHVDLKYLYDVRKKKYACLSSLDLGTVKHQAVMIKTRRSDYVAAKFLKHWILQFGVPDKVVHDQGGEFEQSFALLMEQFSIPTEVTAAHAGWQLSAGERHGGILGVMVQAVVDEHQVEGYSGMRLALPAATAAKNATISKEGFTPDQRVFGKECVWPSLTDEDEKLGFAEGLSTESEVARAHRMRTSARIALLRQDVREKLRRAILRKPAAAVMEYVPGAQIYFWTPKRDTARYKTGGEWRGPATVLVKEQGKRYFCSWRGRLLLLAPENMRMATGEEMMMTEQVKDEVVDAADMLRDPMRSNVFQDLRTEKEGDSKETSCTCTRSSS